MEKKPTKWHLVCALLNFLGGAFRLAAAIVDMVSNYPSRNGAKMVQQIPT